MMGSKAKKRVSKKQAPNPLVLATAWIQSDELGRWSIQRHTRGTRVKTAPDGISAQVSFLNPEKMGFVPLVTPVIKRGVAQDLYVSHMGSSSNYSIRVSARTGTSKPIRPRCFTIVIVGM